VNFSRNILNKLLGDLSQNTDDPVNTLYYALRLLSKWRSAMIQNTFIKEEGTKVLQGPLKGLDFIEKSAEGCHVPKLLGSYEQPLHPFIQKSSISDYTKVINIGCAEGYYAVGFAMVAPSLVSYAFDTNGQARKICAKLAQKNGVGDRVKIGSEFGHADFARYGHERVLVFCDIEGAEDELLNPEKAPSLRKLDIIVESHECLRSGVTQRLISRFKATHDIRLVEDNGTRLLEAPPRWFAKLAHLDQLLATWEWRSGPTPWLVMRAKN